MASYTEKDMVRVVGEDGQPLPDFLTPVPAAWVDTDLLPAGAKKAVGRQASKVKDAQPDPVGPGQDPKPS